MTKEKEKQSYYLTTPIYYVNDIPHIGHAYTTLACDFLARFMRLSGRDVKFMTGTDEHGLKVQQSAQKAGIDPQAFTDKVSQNFRHMSHVLNFSDDIFMRTTSEAHKKSARKLWKMIEDNGFIYLGSYSGWYAMRDEAYYQESELTTNDQGQKVAPSGAVCEWVEEPSYFFKLSAFQDKLLAFYEQNPTFIGPDSRKNEVLSFVKGGLQDLSVSRTSFDWGIKVPGHEEHVMYVWLEALSVYISSIGFGDESPEGQAEFKKRWPTQLHMMGKDILRFHAVYWPAFLMAAGVEPPQRVFAHGWWTIEGQKMSKSLGNVISPNELVENFGLDQTRYFLLREVSFGQDGDFSRKAMIQRINSDLSNDYGNLVQRVLSFVYKNNEQKLPKNNGLNEQDKVLLADVYQLISKLMPLMEKQEFSKALEMIWRLISEANRYIDEQAPWSLKKTDTGRMNTVLFVLVELIRCVSIVNQAIMPDSAGKVLDSIMVAKDARSFEHMSEGFAIDSATQIEAPEPVFPRFVE